MEAATYELPKQPASLLTAQAERPISLIFDAECSAFSYVWVRIKRYHVVDYRKGDIGQNRKKVKLSKMTF